ncbi:TPA: prepilin peptidase [Salmonella enterica subsp. enterica serovar Derby]
MRTVIATAVAPEHALPLMLVLIPAGVLLLRRVSVFLHEVSVPFRPGHPAVISGIWLFSLAGMLVLMAPVPLAARFNTVLMLGFLLQMAVTDAVSGYLPRTFTLRFLAAGLLVACLPSSGGLRMVETAATGVLVCLFHVLVNRHGDRIGRGDLWLLTGLTAWTGFDATVQTAVWGTGGFILWHCTGRLTGKKEGPLGPWFCFSCAVLQLNAFYQPVWVWVFQ